MSFALSPPDARRRRRRATAAIKESLRELSIELSLLNHQVGAHVGLKDFDFDCLDLVHRHGPFNPSALARRAGLHPATVTGVVDRLERGGWVVREPDPNDRRSMLIRAVRVRNRELFNLYSEMNTLMDQMCAEYADAELDLLVDFVRRLAQAGQTAAKALASEEDGASLH